MSRDNPNDETAIRHLLAFVSIESRDGREIERMMICRKTFSPMIADSAERLDAHFGEQARRRAAEQGVPLKIARFNRVIDEE